MTRPSTDIDAFSPGAYADERDIAARLGAMRAQGDVLWIDQAPYRPFWAVLRHADIMEVSRNTRVWLNAPRLTLLPDWFEDRTIAQFGSLGVPLSGLNTVFGVVAEHVSEPGHSLARAPDSGLVVPLCSCFEIRFDSLTFEKDVAQSAHGVHVTVRGRALAVSQPGN